MDPQPYRLWLRWQQMHYPRRGLPASQSAVEELLAVDGIAAGLLEPYFEGGRRGRLGLRSDPQSRSELEAQARRLDELIKGLNGEAAVYFGRLRRLIALALVDEPAAGAAFPRQPGGAPRDV